MGEQPHGDGWWQDDKGRWRQGGRPPEPDAPAVASPPPEAERDAEPDAARGERPSVTEATAAPTGRNRLDEILAQIEHLPGGKGFLGRREVKALPTILWEDERVENIIRGFYGTGSGILVATNKRLVFVDKGLARLRVE